MELLSELTLNWADKAAFGSTMTLLFAFAIKHFVVDFLMQKPYQYLNKGTYGHPGGLLHSGLHAFATLVILCQWSASTPPLIAAMTAFDFVTHYHIDWAKVQINKRMGWGANTHEQFWWLLGADQFAHTLVYCIIVGSVA